ncbi:hypothetical protein PRZ48_009172 [Zasmidium cellare]|uniref:Uncharacterized protein n=1 Tax=Zasmidium cellare TaxID=395010 RepID=A0ABR0EB05_ZASCE|nr:hypothetical protein PRZ48_009172 [Zasmidium cellare]
MLYQYLVIAFAALAAAGIVDKRQTTAGGYNNVVKDINIALSDINKVKSDLDVNSSPTYQYTGDQLYALFNDNQQVLYDAGNLTQALQNSNTFNSGDSNNLASIVTASFLPTLTSLLNDLQTHYPGFSSQGVQGAVSSILRQDSSSAAALASAFVTKVSGPATTVAPKVSSSITSAFNKALSVYAN